MKEKFKQISNKPGFMKHNGGIFFRKVSNNEYEFKTTINKNKLNSAGITHGGYICSIIDAGSGTAAHRASNSTPCVTISLDIKFISATKAGDEIKGFAKIQKITKSMIFLICYLKSNSRLVASASGIWKKLNKNISGFGPGG